MYVKVGIKSKLYEKVSLLSMARCSPTRNISALISATVISKSAFFDPYVSSAFCNALLYAQ